MSSVCLCWFPEQSDGLVSQQKDRVTGINCHKPEALEKGLENGITVLELISKSHPVLSLGVR